jgi:hypothetical protein
MKNFIAGAAMLILLIVFPVQTSLEIINEARISKFSNIVYVATQTARTDGYFKQSNIDKMKSELLSAFPDLSPEEIYMVVTTTPKYRTDIFDNRETINYDIRIPVRRIIAAPGLFGISEADNQYMTKKTGFVLSEVLRP